MYTEFIDIPIARCISNLKTFFNFFFFIFFFAIQQTNLTLLVTPLETRLVDCTEVSPEFSDKRLLDQESQVNK